MLLFDRASTPAPAPEPAYQPAPTRTSTSTSTPAHQLAKWWSAPSSRQGDDGVENQWTGNFPVARRWRRWMGVGPAKLKTNRKFPFACFKVGWEARWAVQDPDGQCPKLACTSLGWHPIHYHHHRCRPTFVSCLSLLFLNVGWEGSNVGWGERSLEMSLASSSSSPSPPSSF